MLYWKTTCQFALAIIIAQLAVTRVAALADAPSLARQPAHDLSGLYFFRSYETGRSDFATVILNVHPGQTTAAAPACYPLDNQAYYEICFDRNGDAQEDTTLRFLFSRQVREDALIAVGGEIVELPFAAVPSITESDDSFAFVNDTYSMIAITGDRDDGTLNLVYNESPPSPTTTFAMPLPDVGTNHIPNYSNYAASRIYTISLPGTSTPGRVFVGQRAEPLAANWGELFDHEVSTGITGATNANANTLRKLNVTSIAVELPIDWLLGDSTDDVVSAWGSVRVLDEQGVFQQVARIGNPLFCELFVGISQKDFFNTLEPVEDATASFGDDRAGLLDSLRYPAWPFLLAETFASDGLIAPATPRTDLENTLLRGTDILASSDVPADVLRLNLLLPETPASEQNPQGFPAGDRAGFPNGRRPGDDVVDILLNLANGSLIINGQAPSKHLNLTDGVPINGTFFKDTFPYLNEPRRPSPHDGSFDVLVQSTESLTQPFNNDTPEQIQGNEFLQQNTNQQKHFYRAIIDRPGTTLSIESSGPDITKLRLKADQ